MTDERLAAKVKEWAADPVVKAAIDAENAKYPGITHKLDDNPITISAPQEGVYGPDTQLVSKECKGHIIINDVGEDVGCQGCWECDPSRFDPPAGCQGDPDPAAAKLERDKAGTPNPCGCEVWQICSVCNPEMYYKNLGASADDLSPPENPDRVNAPEPLGEPANIRTELAQLRADLTAVCKFIHDADEPSVIHTMGALASALKRAHEYVRALDSHQKQVDARLDEIEKHTDFSHNSK